MFGGKLACVADEPADFFSETPKRRGGIIFEVAFGPRLLLRSRPEYLCQVRTRVGCYNRLPLFVEYEVDYEEVVTNFPIFPNWGP